MNHANLRGAHTEHHSADESFVCALRARTSPDQLARLADGLLRDFQLVTSDLPTAIGTQERLQVAYVASCALSEAVLVSLETRFPASLALRVAQIAYALEQFLAGDVDDLLEGFQETIATAERR